MRKYQFFFLSSNYINYIVIPPYTYFTLSLVGFRQISSFNIQTTERVLNTTYAGVQTIVLTLLNVRSGVILILIYYIRTNKYEYLFIFVLIRLLAKIWVLNQRPCHARW